MGYYAGPILERDPPGVPLFSVLQYAKSLHTFTHVHIFATNVRFYSLHNHLFINNLISFYYEYHKEKRRR